LSSIYFWRRGEKQGRGGRAREVLASSEGGKGNQPPMKRRKNRIGRRARSSFGATLPILSTFIDGRNSIWLAGS